ncbi:MAG: hypothetical protein AB1757_19105 [Acidobacteriota bacterium]
MAKPAEEGEVWEWRAFGKAGKKLLKKIESYPIRLDPNGKPLNNLIGQDLYLISSTSKHNIKLRKSIGSAWVLKFKLLLKSSAAKIELYSESNKKTFRFPLKPRTLKDTCNLLNVSIPKIKTTKIKAEKFIKLFAQASPEIQLLLVGKVRSQYQTPFGWIEIAEVTFPSRRIQSISLHAFDRKDINKMLKDLPVNKKLKVMNYLEACRKWA